MLNEVLSYLDIKPGAWYVDCNLGGGGHTEGVLKKGGKVLGIDLDPDAINKVAKKHQLKVETIQRHLQAISDNLILYQSNFADLTVIVRQFNPNPILGVLFDLGVSSYQLETAKRGFSFNIEAPLDMRMDPESKVTAADLINGLHEKELAELFWKLGEERAARPIARKIIKYRQNKKIETTNELANIILSVRHRTAGDRTHPATRIFQALRIAVNDELNNLRSGLPQALEVLDHKGRLVIISFHSLEDRIVKNFLKNEGQAFLSYDNEQQNGLIKILTQKPITPTEEEIKANPRARSGKLRAAEKV